MKIMNEEREDTEKLNRIIKYKKEIAEDHNN